MRSLAQHEERSPFEFLDLTTKQNLTHHFKVLRESGLIEARYEGRTKFVWLRRQLIDEIFPGLLNGVLSAVEASRT